MYAKYFKRLIDFSSSLIVLIILSPLLVLLIILGAVFMKGNPFFTQDRQAYKALECRNRCRYQRT